MAAAQQSFEETRRLVDPQLDVSHAVALKLDVQGSLALNPRQCVDANGSCAACAHVRSASSLAFRNGHAHALKLRNARVISTFVWPRMRNSSDSDAVLGVSMGP